MSPPPFYESGEGPIDFGIKGELIKIQIKGGS